MESQEVVYNVSEGMDVLSKRGQAGKEATFLFSMSLCRLTAKDVSQIKHVFSYPKGSELEVDFSTLN